MNPFANPAMGDILEPGRYGAILCDPPWAFESYAATGTPHRTDADHYEVMDLADLQALPVGDLAAKDCLLIMWVIGSHLDQAIALGRHWGFTYKSDGFVWVKTGKHDSSVRPITMGHWTRKQTEYALLFSRGRPKRLDAGVRQLFETDSHVIYSPRREHSRKPDDTHDRVERLVGGPYVELFARERRAGWSSWGDELGKFDLDIADLIGAQPLVELSEDGVSRVMRPVVADDRTRFTCKRTLDSSELHTEKHSSRLVKYPLTQLADADLIG